MRIDPDQTERLQETLLRDVNVPAKIKLQIGQFYAKKMIGLGVPPPWLVYSLARLPYPMHWYPGPFKMWPDREE